MIPCSVYEPVPGLQSQTDRTTLVGGASGLQPELLPKVGWVAWGLFHLGPKHCQRWSVHSLGDLSAFQEPSVLF